MRIAIFTNTYWPTVNGVAVSVEHLRIGLSELGHEVTVFAPAPADFDPASDNEHVIRFPSLNPPVEADYPLALPYSPKILKKLMDQQFDIVHTHHPVWVGTWGQYFASWNGLPLVTTAHTQYEMYTRFVPLPPALVDAFLKVKVTSYCNRCDLVTVPAASARQRLEEQGVETPIEVVPNPMDLSRFVAPDGSEVRRRAGCTDDDVLVGYLGRLSDEKNITMLMKAMTLVLAAESRVRFMLVGDGPVRKSLEKQVAELGIGDRTVFMGKVPNIEVPAYHAAMDLFVTASLSEVQPISYAETMAAQTPLVAVSAPGAVDMVEHGYNGLLVPLETGEKGLADSINELVQDKERRGLMGGNARIWAQQHYDRRQVSLRFVEMYQKAGKFALTKRQ